VVLNPVIVQTDELDYLLLHQATVGAKAVGGTRGLYLPRVEHVLKETVIQIYLSQLFFHINFDQRRLFRLIHFQNYI